MDSSLFLYVIIAVIVIAVIGMLAFQKKKNGGATEATKDEASATENASAESSETEAKKDEPSASNATADDNAKDGGAKDESTGDTGSNANADGDAADKKPASDDSPEAADDNTPEEQADEPAAPLTEEEALNQAQMQMAQAHQRIHDALEAFHHFHDELIAGIYHEAKSGCDALFKQRFGVTRPPRAKQPQDDPEVQDFLRENYAALRDVVLAKATLYLMDEETQRRLNALTAEEEAAEPAAADTKTVAQPEEMPETTDAAPEEETGDKEHATKAGDSAESKTDQDAAAESEAETEAESESESADSSEADTLRAEIAQKVRAEFDPESVRVYILAAISARYNEQGNAIGDLPWPAYATMSSKGYGELVLCEGAPVFAQDAYREYTWKRFHTGKRAEKPTRGEYSWPASHGLGDGMTLYQLETPAGTFTAEGPQGVLPLCEWIDCAWMRHSLEYQGALLVPAAQRSFLINIEGLHKGDTVTLSFDGGDFLHDIGDSAYFLNAMGEAPDMPGSFVGISISNANAASPGEAPYEVESRDGKGFQLRMTQDARHYDADTYPQFVEAHIAWAQEPSPRPERIIRHVTH